MNISCLMNISFKQTQNPKRLQYWPWCMVVEIGPTKSASMPNKDNIIREEKKFLIICFWGCWIWGQLVLSSQNQGHIKVMSTKISKAKSRIEIHNSRKLIVGIFTGVIFLGFIFKLSWLQTDGLKLTSYSDSVTSKTHELSNLARAASF